MFLGSYVLIFLCSYVLPNSKSFAVLILMFLCYYVLLFVMHCHLALKLSFFFFLISWRESERGKAAAVVLPMWLLRRVRAPRTWRFGWSCSFCCVNMLESSLMLLCLRCSWQFRFLWLVVCEFLMRLFLMFLVVEIPMKKQLQCYMVAWGHFSTEVAQHAMMLFEKDLSLYSDGMLDLGLVNSVSACGNHGHESKGSRDFWQIWSKKVHIIATPFMVPLQARGRKDL
jgi:hypothetical protein